MMMWGAFDGSSLFEYIKHYLIPQLRRGRIIIWGIFDGVGLVLAVTLSAAPGP